MSMLKHISDILFIIEGLVGNKGICHLKVKSSFGVILVPKSYS